MRRDSRWPGNRGVSPVIGVVLLVAIAVTLMATVGVFIVGLGPGEQTPRGELLFAQEEGNVSITVASGEGLVAEELSIRVDNEDACLEDENAWSGSLQDGDVTKVTGSNPNGSCDGLDDDQVVRVVWEATGGTRSEIIAQWRFR